MKRETHKSGVPHPSTVLKPFGTHLQVDCINTVGRNRGSLCRRSAGPFMRGNLGSFMKLAVLEKTETLKEYIYIIHIVYERDIDIDIFTYTTSFPSLLIPF